MKYNGKRLCIVTVTIFKDYLIGLVFLSSFYLYLKISKIVTDWNILASLFTDSLSVFTIQTMNAILQEILNDSETLITESIKRNQSDCFHLSVPLPLL